MLSSWPRILQIADDSGNDWIEKKTKQGRTWREPNNAAIQRSRLRVETRKYLMEKWSAHHYGAMQRLELTGPGGGPILLEQIAMVAVAKLRRKGRLPPVLDRQRSMIRRTRPSRSEL